MRQSKHKLPGTSDEISGDSGARAATAVVFDYETQWMFEIQRHGKTFDYQTLVFDYYESLRELGLDVDIVSSLADLSAYRLVVVPSLAVIDDATAFVRELLQSRRAALEAIAGRLIEKEVIDSRELWQLLEQHNAAIRVASEPMERQPT